MDRSSWRACRNLPAEGMCGARRAVRPNFFRWAKAFGGTPVRKSSPRQLGNLAFHPDLCAKDVGGRKGCQWRLGALFAQTARKNEQAQGGALDRRSKLPT